MPSLSQSGWQLSGMPFVVAVVAGELAAVGQTVRVAVGFELALVEDAVRRARARTVLVERRVLLDLDVVGIPLRLQSGKNR
jgi:hypothetical protein